MAFDPIRTARLLIRPVRIDDAEALSDRRSDPAVAHFQNWIAPYPLDRAQSMLAEIAAQPEPVSDEWWMLTVTEADGTIVGDLVMHPTWDSRSIEIGYTFARTSWGKGYAVEAVEALVARLWKDRRVTRLSAMLHPDNVASAQVLERSGFLHEGHTRLSFWLGDDNSDDALYGMLREDWQRWIGRPRHRPTDIRLVEIDHDTFRDVARLTTHHSQQRFVAPVLNSFANALFPGADGAPGDGSPRVPWYRAVEADGALVGFVMMAMRTDHRPEPYLWRLLIDRLHQRRGIGSQVIDLVIDDARRSGATALMVSWVDERGTPAPLYRAKGFIPTGDIDHGEIAARLTL